VGVVQETLKIIKYDVEARTVCRGDAGTEVAQQRLYFAPMYIAADRVMKDGKQQAVMLVTHGNSPLAIDILTSIIPCSELVKCFKKLANQKIQQY
jgi:hypothetical protein